MVNGGYVVLWMRGGRKVKVEGRREVQLGVLNILQALPPSPDLLCLCTIVALNAKFIYESVLPLP